MAPTLKVEKREAKENNHQLRKAGFLPAVVYGHDFANTSLKISYQDFEKIFKEAGESTLINLEISGQKAIPVFVHDFQKDPLTEKYLHIDFYHARMDQKMETEVPLEFTGASPAVEDLEGVLVRNLKTVEVRGLPQNIPHSIAVDLGKLVNFDSQIKISDLAIGKEIEILNKPEEVIAIVLPPRSQEELEALKEETKEEVSQVEGVVKPEEPGVPEEPKGKDEVAEPREKKESSKPSGNE